MLKMIQWRGRLSSAESKSSETRWRCLTYTQVNGTEAAECAVPCVFMLFKKCFISGVLLLELADSQITRYSLVRMGLLTLARACGRLYAGCTLCRGH